MLLGNRTMGAMSDLVSQFEISPCTAVINYQDHPVRVSPLVYADLFKWLQNREQGIPAYVIVDMTPQDAQVVRLEGDKAIKYSESEPRSKHRSLCAAEVSLLHVRREVLRNRRRRQRVVDLPRS